MSISVIIPTYRRPADLTRCLEAIKRQTRPPEEIIVVARYDDVETWRLLNQYATLMLLKTISVDVPGVIAAMNAGLKAASGDILGFTDDDAVPHIDWLEKIETHFLENEQVGGVGGRDLIYQSGSTFEQTQVMVGKLQWYGRMIGNHHIGKGQAREVDFLKGVNMSFRRIAVGNLRFDSRLLGSGAQVHFEVAFCLSLKQKGWKLIYDPTVLVDHYPAMRFDEDQRHNFNETAFFNEIHNETLALLDYLSPIQRVVFLVWSVLVGTRRAFGVIQYFRFLFSEGSLAWRKWIVSMRGRKQGILTWLHVTQQT
ncbi:glycosyltransferase family 2 protein [Thermocoleostomius sinensis]|uniref:Glycosyltransferase n=1 Tax=Thermocoleostomius sinensis A174 TaxID=2016057 RepID=A0A9E9C6N0_9CYAN|nr:glycosyltransferase family 2 protein [Thermocoleostomius sinensis]WAL58383.1 glycosyltransferase [Thermocoleostomius sinensis A174]